MINCGTILGCFTVVCYEWFNAEYSYVKWNEFISNDGYSAYILSILVVITTFYLTCMSVINMFTSLFKFNINYEFQKFYLPYIVIQILICLSSILSVGVYYVVVLDFYHNDYNKSILLTVCCCTTIFMILETGSFAMVNYFFNHLLSIYGTDDDKKLIKLNRQIDK